MKAHLCTLFYILGCVLLAATTTVPPVRRQDHAIAIPPIKPKFVGTVLSDSAESSCLAEAIYHEGRGESVKTQVMIAEVTVNRAKNVSALFPYSICGVVHQRRTKNVCQYSWVCGKHPVKEEVAWVRSRMLAQWIYRHYYLRKDIPDLTKGSLYFTTIETRRSWMQSMNKKVESGSMKFLADN